MIELWLIELEYYSSLTQHQKILWFSRLMFFVSMLARDTYEIGTTAVCKSEELRRFNELLHRISSKQLDVAIDNSEGIPDDQFFEMIGQEIESLGVDSRGLLKRLKATSQ